MTARPDGEVISDTPTRQLVVIAERPEMSITWTRYAAGERGPDLHVHRSHTDSFYVLEGELRFRVGPDAAEVVVGAGGYVAVPPGVVHTFDNASADEACWLNMHCPDTGFIAYLRDLRDGREPDFDSFDPPGDGGLPASNVVVTRPRA